MTMNMAAKKMMIIMLVAMVVLCKACNAHGSLYKQRRMT